MRLKMLLTAILGGVHVIDPGPTWRLLCGLWTGQVTVLWLTLGGAHLRHMCRPVTRSPLRWTGRDKLQAVGIAAGLTILAAAFPLLRGLGWYVWVAVILSGAAVLVIAVAGAAAAVTVWLGVHARRLTRRVRPSPPG